MGQVHETRGIRRGSFPKRTLRTLLVALGLSVASGAVYKFVRVGSTMYAGGASSSVSTPAGVSPGGTFTRSNIVAFTPPPA